MPSRMGMPHSGCTTAWPMRCESSGLLRARAADGTGGQQHRPLRCARGRAGRQFSLHGLLGLLAQRFEFGEVSPAFRASQAATSVSPPRKRMASPRAASWVWGSAGDGGGDLADVALNFRVVVQHACGGRAWPGCWSARRCLRRRWPPWPSPECRVLRPARECRR
jgi:hypothetical protein